MNTFPDHLSKYFKQPGAMTQQQVARQAGIHFVNLNRILHGHTTPSLNTAIAIADVIGFDLGLLLKKRRTKK